MLDNKQQQGCLTVQWGHTRFKEIPQKAVKLDSKVSARREKRNHGFQLRRADRVQNKG